MAKYYDCIVIGGGHAGIEAALASARAGCSTLVVTFSFNTIGQMSCNPAIGGVGKGQLVKEIDALGGEMGLAADATAIQFRQLNKSKGQAVRSSRCQSDQDAYKLYMQDVVRKQKGLDVLEDEVTELMVVNGQVSGIKIQKGEPISCRSIVIATGTFLKGRIHVGSDIVEGGRIGEPNSKKLAENLIDLGFEVLIFKTGTPPRLEGRTIDFSSLQEQHSDEVIIPFSFRTPPISADRALVPCHVTYTNETTHDIITKNMHLSPMYSGQIEATGVRYCPSIEDKLKKFKDKLKHQVFLEPQGLGTSEYYPNGISTGLPRWVQDSFVHSIEGLEKAKITQYGYAIEHGVIPPTELKASLETKRIKGLFLSGQINGTTGYEEAAAQGLIGGINAALSVKGKAPFILGRNESYIGVLIDDLTTKGTQEPYRMFTSRVEYRLIVREENADKRLSGYGFEFGLLSEKEYDDVKRKYESIDQEIRRLRSTKIFPGAAIDQALIDCGSTALKGPTLTSDVLKRPQVSYEMISGYVGHGEEYSPAVIEQIEYEIKYEGFIRRQMKDVEKFRHIENIKIPSDINYDQIPSLSIEIRQKLKLFTPLNLGQALRVSGVTPAAISVMMVYLKKRG